MRGVVRCVVGELLGSKVGVGGDDLVRIGRGGEGLRFELGIESMGEIAESFVLMIGGHRSKVHLRWNEAE